jgi:hypothetical protein
VIRFVAVAIAGLVVLVPLLALDESVAIIVAVLFALIAVVLGWALHGMCGDIF